MSERGAVRRSAAVFAAPFTIGLVCWAFAPTLTGPVLLLLAAAFVGLVTARTCPAGDPSRPTWLLLTATTVTGTIGEVLHLLDHITASRPPMLISNLCWCASIVALTRQVRTAEVLSPLTRGWRFAVGLAVACAALLVLRAAHELAAMPDDGDLAAWLKYARDQVGTLCDAIVLVCGTYLLGALQPLWSGSAVRPLLAFTAASACFVAVDLAVPALVTMRSAGVGIIAGWSLFVVAAHAKLELHHAALAVVSALRTRLANHRALRS